jgi:hydrogenase expression/formation protein HypE
MKIARATGFNVQLLETQIPVNDAVQSVCELLGFDPLYMACEGRIVAVVAPEASACALHALRRVAAAAALIGEIQAGGPQVILETSFGGQRSLDELEEDPLPRIC